MANLRQVSDPATGRADRRDVRRRRLRKNAPFYLFVSPFFVLFLVFGLFPILFSLFLSFQSWGGLGPITFVGLDNYKYLIADPLFHKAIGNTVVLLVLSRGSLIVVSILLAHLFHQLRPRFDRGFRVILFLPMLVSTVAMAQIFTALFDPGSGLVNYLLSVVSGERVEIGWLTDPAYGKFVVTFELWWKFVGWTTILFIVAIEAISKDLYDAAAVDRASRLQLLWHVVLPQLRPIIVFIGVLSIIGGFEMFVEVYSLWGTSSLTMPPGGPDNTAMTTAVYLYQVAFGWNEYGLGAAASFVMFLMIAGFSFAYYRMQVREK